VNNDTIGIKKFEIKYKSAVRKIGCETSFFGRPRADFLDDDEILADALTLYFTDYEPSSCFVALSGDKVVGYILGAKDEKIMQKIFNLKIAPALFFKALKKKLFLKKSAWFFLLNGAWSFFKGEFFAPNLFRDYPAVLHINIDEDFRGFNIGRRLVDNYLNFLKKESIVGVHCVTFSKGAKTFFLKAGFKLLFESKTTFLRYRFGVKFPYYVFGRKVS